jgi:hypothetical protein
MGVCKVLFREEVARLPARLHFALSFRRREPIGRSYALGPVPEQRLLDGVAPSALEQRLIDAVGPSDFNIYEGHLTKPQMAKAMGRNQRTLDTGTATKSGPA